MRTRRFLEPGRHERLGPVWWVVLAVIYVPFSVLIRIRYHDLKKLPQDGPVLLVTNHVSHVDPFMIGKLVIDAGRRPRFLAKDTIFAIPVVGAAMRTMGHIAVRRGTGDAREALNAAVAALRSGGLIVMHPEGTVTRDPEGWPMAGRTGAARLWLLAPEVPVIPVAQWGVQQQIDLYRRRVRFIPRPRHELSVGDPIDLSAFAGRRADAATLREVTEVIMRRLRADVAELRGVAEPTGDLYRWVRPAAPKDAA